MVTPTPFQRLLHQASERAQSDPTAAFDAIEALYGKCSTAEDAQQLCAFAANIGGAVVGRLDQTQELLDRLLALPAVAEADDVRRSILRAKSVLHTVAGEEEQAAATREAGVSNASEQCRLAIMTAQTFTARQQAHQAVSYLRQSSAICQELAADDPIIQQVAQIAANLVRLAEQQSKRAHELLLAASGAVLESMSRMAEWQHQHMALFQRAKAQLTVGNPTAALAAVQRMMTLEQEHDADAFFRFQSAQLACRAQLIRGQSKVAKGALQACRDLAGQIQNPDWKRQTEKSLADLELTCGKRPEQI